MTPSFDELDHDATLIRVRLASGECASTIANERHSRGLGNIALIYLFKRATGTSLSDLKAFGQWRGAEGVTDFDSFDGWAQKVFPHLTATQD